MLTSQVIFLKLKSGNPENINGSHIHGLFFKEILKNYDTSLADYLHQPNMPKAFSLSYIYQDYGLYWFRIASWMRDIADAVFSYFNSNFEIILNNCVFELAKTSTDNKESYWANRININNFLDESKNTYKDIFRLEHFSPTSFKNGDSHIPLPMPEFIIKSIYKQMPLSMQEYLQTEPELLIKFIQLKEHRIYSVYNRKNHGAITSFEGKTRWQIDKKASQQEKEAIWTIFRFAFYSGIGVKTTQGMGMCRASDSF
ncbi:MAG: CRISPR-associated endoribonuclease Cas6 [Desulfobacterales bacterium]|nr:CRISPR-associated endoribonuclease Cas6 [Desulfobacterales bacterium]